MEALSGNDGGALVHNLEQENRALRIHHEHYQKQLGRLDAVDLAPQSGPHTQQQPVQPALPQLPQQLQPAGEHQRANVSAFTSAGSLGLPPLNVPQLSKLHAGTSLCNGICGMTRMLCIKHVAHAYFVHADATESISFSVLVTALRLASSPCHVNDAGTTLEEGGFSELPDSIAPPGIMQHLQTPHVVHPATQPAPPISAADSQPPLNRQISVSSTMAVQAAAAAAAAAAGSESNDVNAATAESLKAHASALKVRAAFTRRQICSADSRPFRKDHIVHAQSALLCYIIQNCYF